MDRKFVYVIFIMLILSSITSNYFLYEQNKKLQKQLEELDIQNRLIYDLYLETISQKIVLPT